MTQPRRASDEAPEEAGIIDDETVAVDGKVGRERDLEAVEAIETPRLEGSVALAPRCDGERRHADIGDRNGGGLSGREIEPPDRQSVREGSRLDIDVDAAGKSGFRIAVETNGTVPGVSAPRSACRRRSRDDPCRGFAW